MELYQPKQFAFRPGVDVGTTACLKDAISKWVINKDKKKYTVITSFGLKAAFPTLSIDILLSKMKSLGFDQKSINWFEDYLSYRDIRVKVMDIMSDKLRTNKQVSEGSQLSRTFFLMQVCDINNYLKYAKSNSFADDQVQSNSHKTLNIALKRAEHDANNTVTFFKTNKFAIQPDKTALIVIRPNNKKNNLDKANIIVDGQKIVESDRLKMLGMIIDNKLKFVEHCNLIIVKSRKIIAAIRRLSPYIDIKAAKTFFKDA